MNPKVTFIIPCYNLAHFLSECVRSILSQTCRDFEILIMDDCSPDNTAAVAQSFKDERLIYVRNGSNLGHLRNYNKGIDLARGEYVWLISADDRLRSSEVLARFVEVLDAHPSVGYVFCPSIALVDGCENGVVKWLYQDESDKIFTGHDFFKLIIEHNLISSPAVLVRKDCYKLSKFPLDLPYSGDWYFWCFLALHYDVAYLADPMVYARVHARNMSWEFMGPKVDQQISEEIGMRWKIKRAAENAEDMAAAGACEEAIINDYIDRVFGKGDNHWRFGRTVDTFERSLTSHSKAPKEIRRIRARVYSSLGDRYYWKNDGNQSLKFYRLALKERFSTNQWIKTMLLDCGGPGKRLLQVLSIARQILLSQILKRIPDEIRLQRR
jgi:glycosyltransferase involved in cell wall biosynthesis